MSDRTVVRTVTETRASVRNVGPAGRSQYESYVATTTDDPVLSEEEWSAAGGGGGVSDVSDLTTTGLTAAHMLRVAAAGGLEARTPAQVLSDIGALPATNPSIIGSLTITAYGYMVTDLVPQLANDWTHTRPDANGTLALTGNKWGLPDQLDVPTGGLVTIGDGSVLTINSTTISFGTGAAKVLREAGYCVGSDPAELTGHSALTRVKRHFACTQAQYDALGANKDANTIYDIY